MTQMRWAKLADQFQGIYKVSLPKIFQIQFGINNGYNNFEFLQSNRIQRPWLSQIRSFRLFCPKPKSTSAFIPLFHWLYGYFAKNHYYPFQSVKKGISCAQLAAILWECLIFVKDTWTAARNYNLGKVIDIFRYLKEADSSLQRSGFWKHDHAENLRELVTRSLHWLAKPKLVDLAFWNKNWLDEFSCKCVAAHSPR